MLTLGADPGLTGAVAILDGDGVPVLVADLPIVRDRSLAWVDGSQLPVLIVEALQGRPCRAIVERVASMPKQGVASSFQFGVSFGSLLALLQSLSLPIELVTAAQWKRQLGLSSDKRASLDRARLAFPAADLGLAKHHGRAEALLLAHWAMRRVQ